jgi:hypothetical protein
MTMWLKVREAKLDPSLRDFFEQVGEQIVGLALAIEATRGNGNHVTQIAPTQAMNVIYEHQDEAARWLIERRDLAERRACDCPADFWTASVDASCTPCAARMTAW